MGPRPSGQVRQLNSHSEDHDSDQKGSWHVGNLKRRQRRWDVPGALAALFQLSPAVCKKGLGVTELALVLLLCVTDCPALTRKSTCSNWIERVRDAGPQGLHSLVFNWLPPCRWKPSYVPSFARALLQHLQQHR